jgi:prepilin-type N-terminal cleavage/methylation domain-containing protein
MERLSNSRGFSLLEVVIAIGMLGIIISSLVGFQSSSYRAIQASEQNLKSSWVMRAAYEQTKYNLDNIGVFKFPKTVNYSSSLDPSFSVTITKSVLDRFKPSELIKSFFKIAKLQGNMESSELSKKSTAVSTLGFELDGSIKPNSFCKMSILVSWLVGKKKQVFESRFFYIDKEPFN